MSAEDNKNNDSDNKTEEGKSRQLLAASALIPLLCALSQPPNFKALIYSVFIVNYLIKTRAREKPATVLAESQPSATSLSIWQKLEFVALFVACGMIVQTLDYLGHLSFPVHTLWSPSWIYFGPSEASVAWQFIMTFRVMAALALAWLIALRFFVISEKEFFKIAVVFGAVLTAMDYMPVISLPNLEATLAGAIYFGSIAAIAATPLGLPEKVQYKGKIGAKEVYMLTMILLYAAVKLVIRFSPIPALGGG
ncbi:MAG: hypothetical protein QG574_4727 [Cyanobacteriota bacterium erpe_2018_sw_21hr_WHONDRS-SW48-000092_B_bin.40]|nr:hypothetical protein [Cyanobacteriota bacterium erpe_2018_sw_21hr_WHONDRS-SW48-000092_B_bin.40]